MEYLVGLGIITVLLVIVHALGVFIRLSEAEEGLKRQSLEINIINQRLKRLEEEMPQKANREH